MVFTKRSSTRVRAQANECKRKDFYSKVLATKLVTISPIKLISADVPPIALGCRSTKLCSVRNPTVLTAIIGLHDAAFPSIAALKRPAKKFLATISSLTANFAAITAVLAPKFSLEQFLIRTLIIIDAVNQKFVNVNNNNFNFNSISFISSASALCPTSCRHRPF